MAQIKLADYILLLDRMLERRGFTEEERDKVLNLPYNLDLISQEFEKRAHPLIIIKKMDMNPIRAEYAMEECFVYESLEEFTLNEKKRVPRTKKAKQAKFSKVMHHWKHEGQHIGKSDKIVPRTKKGQKQALAIAFSMSGQSKKK